MKQNQGFSLIELMISISISLLIVAGLVSFYQEIKATQEITLSKSQLRKNAMRGLNIIENASIQAGYVPQHLITGAIESIYPAQPPFLPGQTLLVTQTRYGNGLKIRTKGEKNTFLNDCTGHKIKQNYSISMVFEIIEGQLTCQSEHTNDLTEETTKHSSFPK